MIKIYAFCGMGKTTLCNKHGYVDDDMFFPNRPTIKPTDIVLTNEPTETCMRISYHHVMKQHLVNYQKINKNSLTNIKIC